MRGDSFEIIYPNQMSYGETLELIRNGTLEPVVDQTLAIAAARNGVPISGGGRLAMLLMPACVIAGVVMALAVAWWWLIVGIAAAIGNFRVARSACSRACISEGLKYERLFHILRDQGAISFRFRDD